MRLLDHGKSLWPLWLWISAWFCAHHRETQAWMRTCPDIERGCHWVRSPNPWGRALCACLSARLGHQSGGLLRATIQTLSELLPFCHAQHEDQEEGFDLAACLGRHCHC